MEFSVSLDYLTITGKHDFPLNNPINATKIASGLLLARMKELGIDHGRALKTGKHHPFYEYTFKDEEYKIDAFLSVNGQTQGWMIRLSGEALRMQAYPDQIILAAKQAGCRITRLDVAFDFMGCEETTDTVYAAYEGRQKGGRTLKTQVIYSPTGTTFYVGSRSSERMLRIYDKGWQQGLEVVWTRVELELKGDLANLNAEAIANNSGVAAAMISDILPVRGLCITDTIADYADGVDVEIAKPPVSQSDTVRWLRTQVLSAFKKLVESDRTAALNILAEYEVALRGAAGIGADDAEPLTPS